LIDYKSFVEKAVELKEAYLKNKIVDFDGFKEKI